MGRESWRQLTDTRAAERSPVLSADARTLYYLADNNIFALDLVRGAVLKGPTAECLRWAGRTLDSNGIVDHYEGLIDALVADERAEHMPTLETDVDLSTASARRRVAHDVLAFASALA